MLKNPKATKDDIVSWIRNYFAVNGPECYAVVGISGGKDSSVVASLCAEALGKDRVFGVLMPNVYQDDIGDSLSLVKELGIKSCTINIGPAVSGLMAQILTTDLDVGEQAQTNLPPRIRMATLYAVAQSLPTGGRVANTCNLSEDYVGYSTKFGDSVGDFSPLSNLLVHEVLQIGRELGLPAHLVEKTPSDGLCGKTDEDNLGFTYAVLDRYIETGECDDQQIKERIDRLHERNLHKLMPMPAFRLPQNREMISPKLPYAQE